MLDICFELFKSEIIYEKQYHLDHDLENDISDNNGCSDSTKNELEKALKESEAEIEKAIINHPFFDNISEEKINEFIKFAISCGHLTVYEEGSIIIKLLKNRNEALIHITTPAFFMYTRQLSYVLKIILASSQMIIHPTVKDNMETCIELIFDFTEKSNSIVSSFKKAFM